MTGKSSPTVHKTYAELNRDLNDMLRESASPSRNQRSPTAKDDYDTTDNDSSIHSVSPKPTKQEQSKYSPRPDTPKSSTDNKYNVKIIILSVIVLLFGLFIGLKFKGSNSINPTGGKVDCKNFLDLSKEFPQQNQRIFKMLKSGVEGVRDDGNVLVFSLFSTDQTLMSKFVRRAVQMTQECLNNTMDPIKLNEKQIDEEMIVKYKNKLLDSSIMILNNVDKAEIGHVHVLHSFCDTYNPLVKPLAIFITMEVSSSPTGKEIDFIQKHLRNRWQDLTSNVRDPLITRILDQTFFLKPQ